MASSRGFLSGSGCGSSGGGGGGGGGGDLSTGFSGALQHNSELTTSSNALVTSSDARSP